MGPCYDHVAPLINPGRADVHEEQHPTGTDDASVPDKDVEKVIRGDFPAASSGGSTCLDPTHSSTANHDTVTEQGEEDFVYLDAPDTSSDPQNSPRNRDSVVHVGDESPGNDMDRGSSPTSQNSEQSGLAYIDHPYPPGMYFGNQFPDKDLNYVSLFAAPESGQNSLASSDPTQILGILRPSVAEQQREELPNPHAENTVPYALCNSTLPVSRESGWNDFAPSSVPLFPSKSVSLAEQQKEELPNPHATNTIPYPLRSSGKWHPHPSGLYFDGQFSSRHANHVSQHALPVVRESGKSEFARSSPSPFASQRICVVEQQKEEFPNPYVADTVPSAMRSPENWHQHLPGTYFESQFPAHDAKPLSSCDFPAPGDGENGRAGPESTHHPTKVASVSEQRKVEVPNIVLFGETGVGKSSIINLIANQRLARTSNGTVGCTFQHERYPIIVDKTSCALWDTTGLDEGTEGTVPAKQAEHNLSELMRGLLRSGGIHLVIYCVRGTRLTKALKRNYDLFYVTVCRKKVAVALVVTGLEHQQGEMETWWAMNKATLRKNGMRFDAHACVTTVDAEDRVIRQRRSYSAALLRELVTKYAKLPAWKADPSFISRVLPVLHSVFRGTHSPGSPGSHTVIRKVTVCGAFTEFLPGTTAVWNKSMGKIGNKSYEFLRVDKHALDTLPPTAAESVGAVGAGVLVFYTSALVNNRIPPTDVDALKKFYNVADGHTCPVIVVLRDCDDENVAQACRVEVALRYRDIQAYFVSFPSTDDARTNLDEMIESLCIEQVDVKTPGFFKRYVLNKRFLAPLMDSGAENGGGERDRRVLQGGVERV